MHRLLLPIFFAASVLAADPVALPSDFTLCSKSDPHFNDCLRSAVQAAIPILVKGVRPLGVLSIDPLRVTSLGINQGEGAVAINLDFTDLSIHGISKIKVESVDAQLNGDIKTLTLKISTNEILSLEGKYKIAGKVLILPISGTGYSKIELLGAQASITFTGKTGMKDGHKYLAFTKVNFDLNPKTVRLHFENLFNGDKALGDNMNKFLNENWEEVYKELKQPIQDAFGITFIEITNRMFTKVPYDKIFRQ